MRASHHLIWALALLTTTAACASTGSAPRPFPGAPVAAVPTPHTAPTRPASALVPALLDTALDLRGVPYRNGGSDPDGFDCSGFTQWVFAQHGVRLPREVRDQFRLGADVAPEELVAGDLVFFTTTSRGASHVAIVIGDDQFVHAPSSTGVVRVERLSSSYWSRRFVGARRVLE